jgi:hypothetical protein
VQGGIGASMRFRLLQNAADKRPIAFVLRRGSVAAGRATLALAARLLAERPALDLGGFDRIDGRPELGFLIRPFRAAGESSARRISIPCMASASAAGANHSPSRLARQSIRMARMVVLTY